MKIQHGKNLETEVKIGKLGLCGDLILSEERQNEIVLFAHGSGSSRHSSRNRYVAHILNEAGYGTLLMDLLTPAEEQEDAFTGHLRFNIKLLADRLMEASDWLEYTVTPRLKPKTQLRLGYFGASTGAAAALLAAVKRPHGVQAVVSRGGRPDLAGDALQEVRVPALLIVGGADTVVLDLNRQALAAIASEKKELAIIPGATHLFEEAGALEKAALLARNWFNLYLRE